MRWLAMMVEIQALLWCSCVCHITTPSEILRLNHSEYCNEKGQQLKLLAFQDVSTSTRDSQSVTDTCVFIWSTDIIFLIFFSKTWHYILKFKQKQRWTVSVSLFSWWQLANIFGCKNVLRFIKSHNFEYNFSREDFNWGMENKMQCNSTTHSLLITE